MNYNFAITDAKILNENKDSRFLTMECLVCRSGENSHRIPITRDAIKDAAPTLQGVPLLAEFTYDDNDFYGHGVYEEENMVGFFVEEEPQLVEQDGELYIKGKAKLWKRYFPQAVDILKRKNGEAPMSMEMECLDWEEATPTKDGIVNKFQFLGVTLLSVKPSIQGSKARVLSFSEMKDEYNKENQSELEKFSEERRKFMAQKYKINKTELKTTPWGDVDKTAMRNKIMKAINKATLVKSVYALVEDGWQDAPTEHLKYPIMQLVGDTFYYNRYALSSALAYAKQENETSVINKVEKLYKKFNLDDEGGDDKNMAEDKKKKMPEETLENQETEVMEEQVESEDAEDMSEEEMQDEETFADDDEEVDKADEDDEPDDNDPEDSDENAEEFEESECSDNEEEMCDGKMSLDVNVYAGAMLEMLKAETDEQRDEARKLGLSDDEKLNIVMEECYSIACELAELRQFRVDTLKEKTAFETTQILAEVKQDLPQDKYAELEAEAGKCQFEEVEDFRVKARAFAYEFGVKKKDKKKDEHIRMGFDFGQSHKVDTNVFVKILNK